MKISLCHEEDQDACTVAGTVTPFLFAVAGVGLSKLLFVRRFGGIESDAWFFSASLLSMGPW